MKVLGIIPARFASSRFPGKPLVKIDGISMIERVYKGAYECNQITKLVVATDSEEIYQQVLGFGGKAVMTDPNHENGTLRSIEVYEKYKTDFDADDWVINIQGDEPLINGGLLDELITTIRRHPRADIITLVRKFDADQDPSNPNIVKCVFDQNQKALYFSRCPIPFIRNNTSEVIHYQHLGIYAFRARVLSQLKYLQPGNLESIELLEQLRWLENGYSIYLGITDYVSHGVDIPSDVEKIENILKNKMKISN